MACRRAFTIDFDQITQDLRRRQGGYGRGQRMAIESDRAEFVAGVRRGKTTGGPIALLDRQQGLEELAAARCTSRRRRRKARPARDARRSSGRGPDMPISPAG